MNKELKALMTKYDITQEDLSNVLNCTRKTIGKKINEGKFSQIELLKLHEYFKKYDRTLDPSIFLQDKLHNRQHKSLFLK